MKLKIRKILTIMIAAVTALLTLNRAEVAADDITVAAYMNYGEGDVLYYTTAYSGWAADYPSTGGRWPAYCIDHERYGPWTGNDFYSGLTISQQNRLGYIFRNGYPNKDWGLSGAEAQYLTQAAVYGIMGSHASMYELEERVHSPAWIYANVFGYSYTEDSWSRPGNFGIAESLYNSALSNASSEDAAFCILFEPYNKTANLQRMAVPVPDRAGLRIRKSPQINCGYLSGNANYSLEGAVYGVYSDPACTAGVGELTTDAEGVSGYLDLDPGTYYVKEISPSRGYKLNTEVSVVVVTAGENRTLDVSEPAEGDPVAINIIKESANNSAERKLSGAEFTLTYSYPGTDGTDHEMQLVYASNENGIVNLQSPSYLVAGDPYTDPVTGAILFFAGHISVRETKAPEGYIPDEGFELSADLQVDSEGNISISYDAGSLTIENDSLHVVNVPELKLRTKALDVQNMTQTATLGVRTMITDTVTVIDAVVGETVQISGYPVFREDFTAGDGTEYLAGDPVPYDGDRSEDSIIYTAEAEEETKVLKFCLDTVNLNGAEIVFFADGSAGVAADSHHMPDDEEEFISIPSLPVIRTTASDANTKDHVGTVKDEAVIIDEVSLSGLIPGTVYTLEGSLVYKNDHTDPEGKEHKCGDPVCCLQSSAPSRTFTATSEEMNISLMFTVNSNDLSGTGVVAFEKLYNRGVLFASHEDISDEGQIVSFPRIKTELTDKDSRSHFLHASEELTLTDTVYYENLIPGETYSIEGRLMDRENREALADDSGNAIVSEPVEFVPEEPDGSVEIVFSFPGAALEGVTAVAFETLSHEGCIVDVHEDYDDEGQTVFFAGIETSLNGKNKSKEAPADKDLTLTDTVSYWNLNTDHEYELSGSLVDRKSGETVKDSSGNVIMGTTTFKPETPDGTAEVTFRFDASELAGTSVTAFEELMDLEIQELAAVHKDIESAEQTVSFPEIGTTLSGTDGEKSLPAGSREIKLKDTVSYKNLVPGKSYVVSGILMDKETGEPALDGKGNQITAETEFVPEKEAGEAEVIFTFRAPGLEGKSLVAFETLRSDAGDVAVHADINDAAQTVSFYKPTTPGTGDANKTVLWICIVSAAAVVFGALIIYRKRKLLKNK